MNWKTWVPLVLAIVLGVVAAKAARDVMLKNGSDRANSAKFTKVVVVKGDIHPGAALDRGDLAVAQVENAHVPDGSFRSVGDVIGRVTETAMVKGQPVVEAMLAPLGAGSGLQALVPAGMRAITMEVNEYSGVAGLITPGCRVDVIATINDSKGDGRIAKAIVQNAKVTAVGQRTSSGGAAAAPAAGQEMTKSVTILASLEDAEAIELAYATGRPRLVLRGGRDNEVATTVGVSMNDLKGIGSRPDTGTSSIATVTPPPPTPPVAPVVVIAPPTPPATRPSEIAAPREPARRIVRVIKGGRVSLVSLAMPEEVGADDEGIAGGEQRDELGEDDLGEDAVGTIDMFESK